jgi:benzodiazapine receptor
MQRTISDWGGNIGAFILLILVNVLSSSVPLGGQTMIEISAKYPSLFTPAGFTFAIWGLIYLGLTLFVIYQALPGQRSDPLLPRISFLFKLNCLLNAAWVILWHYDYLFLSLILMLGILLTLILIYRSLEGTRAEAKSIRFLVMTGPFSLYTGWICVATIANMSAVQTGMAWDSVGTDPVTWTLIKLALAGAVAATVVLRNADAVFALVIVWAAYGISVKQVATPDVAAAATVIALLVLLLVISSLYHQAMLRLKPHS